MSIWIAATVGFVFGWLVSALFVTGRTGEDEFWSLPPSDRDRAHAWHGETLEDDEDWKE